MTTFHAYTSEGEYLGHWKGAPEDYEATHPGVVSGNSPTVDTSVKPSQVIVERDRRMVALASAYTQTERETWHVQTREAEAVLADANAPTPMLTPIAQARGVTVEQMAQHVLGLEADFAAASGAILAAARVLTDSDPIPADFTDDRHWP